MPRPYCSAILAPLGLVAGMFDALGIGNVLDHATQQTPETRFVTVGHAVKAMVLNGLGFVNQQLSLVPMFFHNKPTQRLVAPGIEAGHLNDESLGRALDTLYTSGVTALYRLIAATAAQRLGLPRALPILIAPVSMLMGALIARRSPKSRSSTSPAAIPSSIAFAPRSKPMMRHSQTTRGTRSNTPPRAGCFSILWECTCYGCLARVPWSSISTTSIGNCLGAWANRICGLMGSNIPRKLPWRCGMSGACAPDSTQTSRGWAKRNSRVSL